MVKRRFPLGRGSNSGPLDQFRDRNSQRISYNDLRIIICLLEEFHLVMSMKN